MQENAYSHRKSTGKLRFVDASGKPAANAEISYQLKNPEFLFGVGAFDSLNAAETALNDTPEQKSARERIDKMARVFNYGTIPFYWGGFEPVEGQPQTENRMKAAKYLGEHGIRVKGHPLCWHTVCADWLMAYDNKTILKKQLDRIEREVTAFRGIVDMWDVINEVVIMPEFDRYDNAVTRICREYGQVNLVKMVFDAAKACNPNATLLINDFNLSDSYRRLIADCLDAGVPIDAIGLQSHQHQGYRGREYFEEVLDRFSCFGLPLHFTENTLVSGKIMPPHIVDLNDYQVDQWPSTPEGEERQCAEWLDMYDLLFAHPLVEAVTGWDLVDGGWLNAPSGLLRADNSEKPVFRALEQRIRKDWSSAGTLHTDSAGNACIEGFRGAYALTASGKTAEYTLRKNNEETVTVILK